MYNQFTEHNTAAGRVTGPTRGMALQIAWEDT
jgi:hypothetical protein